MIEQTDAAQKSVLPRIAKATGGISAVLIGIKILGFFEKLALANFFGTGYQVDAYVVGFSLMMIFWDFLRGLLEPSYLPTLIAYRAEVGEEKSWEFTSSVLNLMGLVFIGTIVLGLLFTPQLVALIAPGFVGPRFQVAVGMTRLMLTGAGFFALAIITGYTLNSYKRFLLAVMDDVVFKVSGFVGLVLLHRYIGIYGLGLGIALGSWIAPCIHLIGLRKYLPWYKLTFNFRSAPFRKMLALMAPLVVGTACIESRRLVDNYFASKLRIGSVAALEFGYRLIEFAYAFLAKPLGWVALPYFSEMAQARDHTQLSAALMTTLRTVLLLFTPMAVCLFMLRYPVVKFLFERGEFDAVSTQFTVTALTYYALGLISYAVEILLTRAYFSLSNTMIPAIMEVVTIILHIGIIYGCIGTLAHGGIALAFTVSKTIKIVILYGLLKHKLEELDNAGMVRFLGKMLAASGVMMIMMVGYQRWFAATFDLSAFFPQALLIGTCGGFGVVIFFSIALALRVQELRLLWQAIKTYRNR